MNYDELLFKQTLHALMAQHDTVTHEEIQSAMCRVIPEMEAALKADSETAFDILTELVENTYLTITENSSGKLKPEWRGKPKLTAV